MVSLFLAAALAASAPQQRPAAPQIGRDEITSMLAVPDHSQLLLVWADGTVSCVDSASGSEVWSTWLPPAAVSDGALTVVGGRVPTLLSLYKDDEDRLFMLVLDAAAEHQPRKVRLGSLGAGMYSIVAVEEEIICVHDGGNDRMYRCSLDGTVQCEMNMQTCLIGAVLARESDPLIVSFHSDRSVIAAQLCGQRRWTRRNEFLEPGGRIGSTVVAVAHNERVVLGLRAEDGTEVWRYPYAEEEHFVAMLADGTLVVASKNDVRLVRYKRDSKPDSVTTLEYAGPVSVVAVGNHEEVACMPGLERQEGNVVHRRSTKVILFNALTGKRVCEWTPVKPSIPTSQAASDWPRILRKK